MNKRTWKKNGWRVEVDRDEIFPDDPGNGAPIMVYAPNGGGSTWNCALDTGWIEEGDKLAMEIPNHIYAWLESIMGEVEDFTWEGVE